MRLWSLHPKYLDRQGLLALWREALLAQAVLRGETRGYRHHPQLARFQCHGAPSAAMAAYLAGVHAESVQRGYCFDGSKVASLQTPQRLPVNSGQLACEWSHLLRKLSARSPDVFARLHGIDAPECHPLFFQRTGGVEDWERQSAAAARPDSVHPPA